MDMGIATEPDWRLPGGEDEGPIHAEALRLLRAYALAEAGRRDAVVAEILECLNDLLLEAERWCDEADS